MGEVVILMGPTGAGKTAQAELLVTAKGWRHLSTGRLLRSDPKVAEQLGDGRLVDSAEVERVLDNALVQVAEEQGILLDGFPRTTDQAEWLEGRLAGMNRSLVRVISIEIDEATSEDRLRKRGRSDDNLAAQHQKWREYESIMLAVADYYRPKGLLSVVDGRGTVEEVAARIKEALS